MENEELQKRKKEECKNELKETKRWKMRSNDKDGKTRSTEEMSLRKEMRRKWSTRRGICDMRIIG